jgi:hypothetical protein
MNSPSAVMSMVRGTRARSFILSNWRAGHPKQEPNGDVSAPRAGRPAAQARGLAAALALAIWSAGSWQARAGDLPPGTESVPLPIRDAVEAAIAVHLVLPETAKWTFEFMTPYITGGKVVCGRVDYQSAMRQYVGPKRFYAVVKHGVVTLSQLQDPPFIDTTGAEARDFALLCDRK